MNGKSKKKDVVGLAVCGGPAPAINRVIYAATLAAIQHGLSVIGFTHGLLWLVKEGKHISPKHYKQLTEKVVAPHKNLGGSIIKTSRTNPTKRPEDLQSVLDGLVVLGVKYFVMIGGDDTLYAAMCLQDLADNQGLDLRFCHVPKTIDNDLPLERGRTFGFESARQEAQQKVSNLDLDAETTELHCHIAVVMGRGAGHLALGTALSAAAHLLLIPEQFNGRHTTIDEVRDIIELKIIERRAKGLNNTIAVLAEGVLQKMEFDHLVGVFGKEHVQRDEFGNIKLGHIPLAMTLCNLLGKSCSRYTPISFIPNDIGYDCRSPIHPTGIDLELCYVLGWLSVDNLIRGERAFMITKRGPVMFSKIPRTPDGKVRTRNVNVHSTEYKVALQCMVWTGKMDVSVARLARAAKMKPTDFLKKFGYLLK